MYAALVMHQQRDSMQKYSYCSKCGLDRSLAKDGEMEGSSYGENVRPVQARKRDVKRENRVSVYLACL